MTQTDGLSHDPYTWFESNFPFIIPEADADGTRVILFREPWYTLATHVEDAARSVETIAELLPLLDFEGLSGALPSPEAVADAAGDINSLVVLARVAFEAIRWVSRNDVEVRQFKLHSGWAAPESLSITEFRGNQVMYVED